jgi:hypothetical protein
MDPKATLCSAALSTPPDDFTSQHPQINDTPHLTNTSTPAPSNPTPNFNFNINFNLDPERFPADPNPNSAGAGAGGSTTLARNPPSNIDWCSLQPIYATSDLVYHDLVGTGAQADGGVAAAWGFQDGGRDAGGMGLVGGQGQGQGQDVMGIGEGAVAVAVAGAVGGGEGGGLPGYCSFGGDFGDDSVWSLLNQYTPF